LVSKRGRSYGFIGERLIASLSSGPFMDRTLREKERERGWEAWDCCETVDADADADADAEEEEENVAVDDVVEEREEPPDDVGARLSGRGVTATRVCLKDRGRIWETIGRGLAATVMCAVGREEDEGGWVAVLAGLERERESVRSRCVAGRDADGHKAERVEDELRWLDRPKR
jgi:hypothetical protein